MKKFSTALIIIGLLIISIPIVGHIYMDIQQEKLYEAYQASLQEAASTLDEAFSEETVSPEGIDATPKEELPPVMGYIQIPSISVNLPIIEGSSSKELKYGAGHVTGTAMPGELGNCAIAGHRNYTFGSYFSRLGEVVEGDVVTISYGQEEYSYTVTEILTVLPSDTSVLAKSETPTITLITCTPKGTNTHRLIIKGSLM